MAPAAAGATWSRWALLGVFALVGALLALDARLWASSSDESREVSQHLRPAPPPSSRGGGGPAGAFELEEEGGSGEADGGGSVAGDGDDSDDGDDDDSDEGRRTASSRLSSR